ncbi:hypothetical protein EJ05DRAFT_275965 [Pseudovirgaria hyperparasitica]|uniref:Uncharacterized protein n=1 Tax=Pseudovirgaria hyperparasitica TaxID=470096 RepID=A0A6A6WDG3_9PEZI|nr:uncharacterized protein EJ05DRAFT_275965 [Pseudovirgaria hyperparasitica]KAF2760219.1 hypothetical protein EJ05DRAFT_275965 [Pseudovirgaria hyperparasitica]
MLRLNYTTVKCPKRIFRSHHQDDNDSNSSAAIPLASSGQGSVRCGPIVTKLPYCREPCQFLIVIVFSVIDRSPWVFLLWIVIVAYLTTQRINTTLSRFISTHVN